MCVQSAPHNLFTDFFAFLSFSFSLAALPVERELLSDTEENHFDAVENFVNFIFGFTFHYIKRQQNRTEHENILLSRADRFVLINF